MLKQNGIFQGWWWLLSFLGWVGTVTDCAVQKSNGFHVHSALYNHSLCLSSDKIFVCDSGWHFVNMLFSVCPPSHLLPDMIIYPSLEYIFSPVCHIKCSGEMLLFMSFHTFLFTIILFIHLFRQHYILLLGSVYH